MTRAPDAAGKERLYFVRETAGRDERCECPYLGRSNNAAFAVYDSMET